MVRKIFLFAALLVPVVSIADGQTLGEYLAMRKKLGIYSAASVAALDVLIGTKTIEIAGVVRGSVAIGGKTTYFLERVDGTTVDVDAPIPVSWLHGNEVHCRLLVRVSRPTETSSLRAVLIGAAPESDVARLEYLNRPKTPLKPSATISKPPLSGPIGKGKAAVANWTVTPGSAVSIYAGFIKSYNKRLTNSEAIYIAQGIIGYSTKYAVDARLIMAMVLVESGFNPNSRSKPGAMGLGQLMPGTAQGLGITNAYDPMQNLYGVARLVRGHIDKYKKITENEYESLVLALAAYNAGSGAVRRNGYQVPPYRETQNYINKVISTYKRFLGY